MPGASADAAGGLVAPGWAGGGRHGKLVGLGLGLGSAAVLALAGPSPTRPSADAAAAVGPPGVWETGALLGRAVGAVLGGGSSGGDGAWSQKTTLATQLRERLAGVLEDLTASERHRRALMADAAAPRDRHQVRCGGGGGRTRCRGWT